MRTVEPFINDLQAAVRELETGKKAPVGHLRIGAPQDFGSTHLTDVIVNFQKKYPEISVELQLATPIALLQMLTDGNLDIAFVDNGDLHAKDYPVSILTVMKEKFIGVCSAQYFDKTVKRKNFKFEDLKKFDFIDYLKHAPVCKMWIKHHFGKLPLDLRVSFSAESVRAVIKAAKGGLGIAVVPEQLVEPEVNSGRLKVLLAETGRDLVNQITLARRLERPISAKERLFVDFYRE